MINKLNNLKSLVNKNVFIPTGTSDLLIEASTKIIRSNKTILDLGCGNGIVGISISKIKNLKRKIYFSDISISACKNARQNCKKFKVNFEIKNGKVFQPWKNYKFDYIVSDIAAIADQVAKVSPWYHNCVNNAGIDGTKNVIKFLDEADFYLNKNGIILFPIISLSNEKKIISVLKKKFNKIKLIKTKTWPLPKSMYKNINLLNKLKKKKIIYFENKYGMLTFKTDIYYAQKKN
jgi:methylase of polypeptide subunit release factors